MRYRHEPADAAVSDVKLRTDVRQRHREHRGVERSEDAPERDGRDEQRRARPICLLEVYGRRGGQSVASR
jgi:hypothetical protein